MNGKNVKCKKCNKNVYRALSELKRSKNSFCSKSCAASFNNKGIRRHGQAPGICLSCQKKVSSYARKYCSQKCQSNYLYNIYISEWLDGKQNGNRGEQVSSRIRKYLFEKHDNKCQKCKWSKVNKVTGKIPLTINHIDGKWKNNRPKNLELICPNCHSLTKNYGALNKGNGRPYRQEWRKKKKQAGA